jgi:hypothetical protein
LTFLDINFDANRFFFFLCVNIECYYFRLNLLCHLLWDEFLDFDAEGQSISMKEHTDLPYLVRDSLRSPTCTELVLAGSHSKSRSQRHNLRDLQTAGAT